VVAEPKLSELFEQARTAQAQDPPRKLARDRHPGIRQVEARGVAVLRHGRPSGLPTK